MSDLSKLPYVVMKDWPEKSGVPTKESILALPTSSGSRLISSSSLKGHMPIIFFPVSIMTKVPHPKKKCDNKGKPTHRSKNKHHIIKMPSDLILGSLMEIIYKYGIMPYIGMMLVPTIYMPLMIL